jgi:DNA-directed RNA polymerase sigma subunit (sigma70/sigma32)
MFERYTKKAGRTIFFGRYEASQCGSPYIESEHLLLGLLREDKALADMFLHSHGAVESIRKEVEGQTAFREKVSTSVDLPISNECKRILAYAAEEAEMLTHQFIGTGHLFLGVLREQDCFAAKLLRERGITLEAARVQIGSDPSVDNHDPNDPVTIYIREVSGVQPLSKDEERKLFRELAGPGGWDEARENVAKRLFEGHLAQVVIIARKHSASSVPMLELIQEGNSSLMNAVKSFAQRPVGDFTEYAATSIEDAIRKAFG